MITRAFRAILAAVLLTTVCTSTAIAVPTTWDLDKVTFTDGGIADGSFVFDADAPAGSQYPSINITTTVGTVRAGSDYGDPVPTSPRNASFLSAVPDASQPGLTGEPYLALPFAAPLTNAGGVRGMIPRPPGFSLESIGVDAACAGVSPSPSDIRDFVSGPVTTLSDTTPPAIVSAPPRSPSATTPSSPVNIDVLTNDDDPDGHALTVTTGTGVLAGDSVTLGSGSVVTLDGDGTIAYLPNPSLAGTGESFTYAISDGKGGLATATVTVKVGSIAVPLRFQSRTRSSICSTAWQVWCS